MRVMTSSVPQKAAKVTGIDYRQLIAPRQSDHGRQGGR
jgi:hypothetical protein